MYSAFPLYPGRNLPPPHAHLVTCVPDVSLVPQNCPFVDFASVTALSLLNGQHFFFLHISACLKMDSDTPHPTVSLPSSAITPFSCSYSLQPFSKELTRPMVITSSPPILPQPTKVGLCSYHSTETPTVMNAHIPLHPVVSFQASSHSTAARIILALLKHCLLQVSMSPQSLGSLLLWPWPLYP